MNIYDPEVACDSTTIPDPIQVVETPEEQH